MHTYVCFPKEANLRSVSLWSLITTCPDFAPSLSSATPQNSTKTRKKTQQPHKTPINHQRAQVSKRPTPTLGTPWTLFGCFGFRYIEFWLLALVKFC